MAIVSPEPLEAAAEARPYADHRLVGPKPEGVVASAAWGGDALLEGLVRQVLGDSAGHALGVAGGVAGLQGGTCLRPGDLGGDLGDRGLRVRCSGGSEGGEDEGGRRGDGGTYATEPSGGGCGSQRTA